MGEMEHVELMIAVDPQTSGNGCLEVVPGSHLTQVPVTNGGRIDSDWESSTEFIQVPMDPGIVSSLIYDQLYHVSC